MAVTEIGFGIVGCGAIAPLHARAIAESEGVRLVAVCDVVEANARKMAEECGCEAYTELAAMLSRDDIHAVSICVPSGLRVELAEACAGAGKHILSEKPLEISVERIDRIIRAADQANVLLGGIFQSRFAQGPRFVHRAMEEERFGKLVMGDAYIKWYRSQEYFDSKGWRGTKKLEGGGALMNQGIHSIDLLLWLMGPVKSVYAHTGLVAHERIEVEDVACALLRFENGAMGCIEGSTAVWPGHGARVEILGVEGSAVLEDGHVRAWDFRKQLPWDDEVKAYMTSESELGSGAGDPLANVTHRGHLKQIQDFADAIREGRPPWIDGREARHSVALIQAIYESAETGQPVELAEK